ncbi:MAG: helix-turn-helix transcriptional regulator [Candidatus Hydrogenedentes bacterium]|nr:helix-turn-helix transcriptional regulator [Candidatus Hydrogenedentota bacterium]
MDKQTDTAWTDALRRAINESGETAYALEKKTSVFRGSIMRFARGEQSITLDLADKLAAYLGVTVHYTPRKKGRQS